MKDEQLRCLVQKAIGANKEAFAELCRKKGQSILYLCIQIMGNVPDGEDAAQEVFLRMHKCLKQLKAPEAFNVWLKRLIITTCADMRRKSMKNRYVVSMDDLEQNMLTGQNERLEEQDDSFIPHAYMENSEKRQELLRVINQLPKNYRISILLFYFEQMNYEEIAAAMNTSAGNVSNYLRRAKQKIQAALEQNKNDDKTVLLPLSAIGAMLRQDAAEKAPAAAVARCIRASEATRRKTALLLFLKGSAFTAAAALLFTLAAAVANAPKPGALQASQYHATPVVLAEDPQPKPGPQAGNVVLEDTFDEPGHALPAVSTLPHGETPSSSVGDKWEQPATPAQQVPVEWPVGSGLLAGWVYLDNPGRRTRDIAYALPGVVFELVPAENPATVLQSATTGSNNQDFFAFSNIEPGTYRVRAILPKNVRFIQGQEDSVLPDPTSPSIGWVTHRGSADIEVQAGGTVLAGLQVPVYYPAEITGSIHSTGAGGQDVPLVHTVQVDLVDARGNVAATAHTAADGTYRFENPLVPQKANYSVRAHCPANAELVAVGGVRSIRLKPGTSARFAPIVMQDMTAPGLSVVLLDGNCACGHINPGGVRLDIEDGSPVRASWILLAASGQPVAEGQGQDTLNEALEALYTKGNAVYKLVVTATDHYGNSAVSERDISVQR